MTRFATTRWSLVLAASDRRNQGGQDALAALCELYWFPVYAFVRSTGRSADAAADLTQGFFTAVVEKGYVGQARQARGRFRSFLLGAVQHFMANEYRMATRQKRGGPAQAHHGQEAVEVRTPEDAFEAQWAMQVLAAARTRLEDKHQKGWMRGSRYFAPLASHVFDEPDERLTDLAARLQTSAGSLRVIAHRVRRQFAACLREVIADTVDTPEMADGELQYLLRVLSRQGRGGQRHEQPRP